MVGELFVALKTDRVPAWSTGSQLSRVIRADDEGVSRCKGQILSLRCRLTDVVAIK